MEAFYPDQRWTSEAEPELGLGTVTETSKGRVRIDFPASGETRLYAAANAPLRRVRFKPGDKIVDAKGRSMVIDRVQEEDHLIVYFGEGRRLSEADLGIVTVKHGADDRLLRGDTDRPETFSLRRRTLEYDHQRRLSPVNGFIGGRIDLIPHQLYIAHEVSGRYAPRVLLSDEVGLGKTIEACLILHRLLLSGRISRVLILVPESLVHQWFLEMLRRFNLWFHIFDEERCKAIEDSAPEGNPFLDDQLIVCSTAFLAGSPKRTMQALAASWDMLVVDEAHHLEWSLEGASPEYRVVEHLSKEAAGLLLLTATPEQLGLESHFARLRLLDPDRYSEYETFKNEARGHQTTADIVEKLSVGDSLNAEEKAFLESLVGKKRVKELKQGDETARNNLMQDLLDQHGPGRVVFRNRRSSLSGFPKRVVNLSPIQAKKNHGEWVERISQEFISQTGTPDFHFGEDPRLIWLLDLMQKLAPAKVLLICKSKEKVLALEKAIKSKVKLKVGVFHEDLTLVLRDRNAAWFAEKKGARLLLCSEIGSEGRNFQFAHHLVLFDLPAHPELLEQRIGRLDRIGQTEDIQIHVPYLKGSAHEVLVRWYHHGLNAFGENLEGGNRMAQLFGERLRELAHSFTDSKQEKALHQLIADTRNAHNQLRENLASGRDRLLEMNSFRPEIAEELIRQIEEADQNLGLESYMEEVFEHFRVEVEDLAARTYLLHGPVGNALPFPGIPDEGISVTFDRTRALSREDISFLSQDHPMITGAIDMVLGTGTGSASFGILNEKGAPAILLEVIFLLETSGENSKGVDRFLPRTPVRVLVDHSGNNLTAKYPEDDLDRSLRMGFIDDLLDNETLVETIIPNMLEIALLIAEKTAEQEIAKGLGRMRATLDHEISRLKTLQEKNNHIRPEEIRIAEEERKNMASLIQDASVRLDAVRLIQRGSF